MATNKRNRDAIVGVSIVVALLATVLVNLLADKRFVRKDLTAEQLYSVSPPFQRIMNRLFEGRDPETTVKLTYYVQNEVLARFENTKRDILDKLGEIRTVAGKTPSGDDRVELAIVDPTTEENKGLRQTLRAAGAEKVEQDFKADQLILVNVFSAIEITYLNKQSVLIPEVRSAEDLELILGNKFMTLTLDDKPVVAIMTPDPKLYRASRQGTGFEWLQKGVWDAERLFNIRPTDMTENNAVPENTSLLILIRPQNLTARQRYEITRYLAGGGNVLLLSSAFKMTRELGIVNKVTSGLEPYLSKLGIVFDKDFLSDQSCVAIPQRDFSGAVVDVSYNTWSVLIKPENIDQDSPFTRFMPGMNMPYPCEIKVDEKILGSQSLKHSVLAKTSAKTTVIPFAPDVSEELMRYFSQFKYDKNQTEFDGSRNVFVYIEGQFPFEFEGKPTPGWMDEEGAPPAPGAKTATVAKKEGKLILCSAPEAFQWTYLQDLSGLNVQVNRDMARANIMLFANIAEISSLGDDLAKVRAKKNETRTLASLAGNENSKTRNFWKFFLVGGFPVLVVAFALLRSLWRKAAQVRHERKFAQTIGPSSFTP